MFRRPHHRALPAALLAGALLLVARPAPAGDQVVTPAPPASEGKLKAIVIPRLAFARLPASLVFAYLTKRSRELDPDRQGVKFSLQLPPATTGSAKPADPPVTVDLKNVTLDEAVRWLCARYGWVSTVTDAGVVIAPAAPAGEPDALRAAPSQALLKRLKAVVIPRLAFDDAPVTTVFAFLAKRSRELDPNSEGVEFVVRLKPAAAGAAAATRAPTVTIELDNLPVADAVRYICAKADLQYRVTGSVVLIYQP